MSTPRNSLRVASGETLKELASKYKIGYEILRYRHHLGVTMPTLVAPVISHDRESKLAAELQGLNTYTCLPCKVCGCTTKNVDNYTCKNRHRHAAIRKERE